MQVSDLGLRPCLPSFYLQSLKNLLHICSVLVYMTGITVSSYLMELLLGINGAMHVKYLAPADCKITYSSLNKDSIILTVRRKELSSMQLSVTPLRLMCLKKRPYYVSIHQLHLPYVIVVNVSALPQFLPHCFVPWLINGSALLLSALKLVEASFLLPAQELLCVPWMSFILQKP